MFSLNFNLLGYFFLDIFKIKQLKGDCSEGIGNYLFFFLQGLPFKIKVTQLYSYWPHEGRKTPRSAVVDVLILFTTFVSAPPSVHWQLLTTVDWHSGRGSRTNCKLLTDPSCTKKEARVKFFHICLYKTPSDVSGCPKLGFVAVCRMSRHEGELLNRSTAPWAGATLPERLTL